MTVRGRIAHLLSDPPAAACLCACAAALGLRRAGAWGNPQFWAEDAYFYERAHDVGWHALAMPYNGYLHTVPRLVAAVANGFDPSLVPGIFVACATLLTLCVAARALSRRCPLPRFAGCCALAVVLVPDTQEVLLNVVNLPWVLAGALVLLLISDDPDGPGQWAHDAGTALFAGLTGPFCILLAPLFAWRAQSRRTRASAGIALIIMGCALVQGCLIATEPGIDGASPGGPVALGLILPAVGLRIGCSLLLGALTPGAVGRSAATVLGIATLLGVGYLATAQGPRRRERALLGLAFAAALAASLYRTRYSMGPYFGQHAHSRYVYVPQLLAIWLALSAAARGDRAGRAAAVLVALGFLANLPRYREPAYADMHWSRYAPLIRAGLPVDIPISPPGWKLTMPGRAK